MIDHPPMPPLTGKEKMGIICGGAVWLGAMGAFGWVLDKLKGKKECRKR